MLEVMCANFVFDGTCGTNNSFLSCCLMLIERVLSHFDNTHSKLYFRCEGRFYEQLSSCDRAINVTIDHTIHTLSIHLNTYGMTMLHLSVLTCTSTSNLTFNFTISCSVTEIHISIMNAHQRKIPRRARIVAQCMYGGTLFVRSFARVVAFMGFIAAARTTRAPRQELSRLCPVLPGTTAEQTSNL